MAVAQVSVVSPLKVRFVKSSTNSPADLTASTLPALSVGDYVDAYVDEVTRQVVVTAKLA